MEIGNTKVVTFQNHYGAMMLKKRMGDCCSIRAVPRSLSSSCGTCVFVSDSDVETIMTHAEKELVEGVYEVTDGGYKKLL